MWMTRYKMFCSETFDIYISLSDVKFKVEPTDAMSLREYLLFR